MSNYLKLAEAPTLSINNPDCSECLVEVVSTGDGWMCPCCGTTWGYNDGEDDQGTLYEEWSGETLDGTPLPDDVAWRVSNGPPELRQVRAEEIVVREGL